MRGSSSTSTWASVHAACGKMDNAPITVASRSGSANAFRKYATAKRRKFVCSRPSRRPEAELAPMAGRSDLRNHEASARLLNRDPSSRKPHRTVSPCRHFAVQYPEIPEHSCKKARSHVTLVRLASAQKDKAPTKVRLRPAYSFIRAPRVPASGSSTTILTWQCICWVSLRRV